MIQLNKIVHQDQGISFEEKRKILDDIRDTASSLIKYGSFCYSIATQEKNKEVIKTLNNDNRFLDITDKISSQLTIFNEIEQRYGFEMKKDYEMETTENLIKTMANMYREALTYKAAETKIQAYEEQLSVAAEIAATNENNIMTQFKNITDKAKKIMLKLENQFFSNSTVQEIEQTRRQLYQELNKQDDIKYENLKQQQQFGNDRFKEDKAIAYDRRQKNRIFNTEAKPIIKEEIPRVNTRQEKDVKDIKETVKNDYGILL